MLSNKNCVDMPRNHKPVNKKHTEQALKDALKKGRELGKCLFCLLFIVCIYVPVLLKVGAIF